MKICFLFFCLICFESDTVYVSWVLLESRIVLVTLHVILLWPPVASSFTLTCIPLIITYDSVFILLSTFIPWFSLFLCQFLC